MISDFSTILTAAVLIATCIYGIKTKYRIWAVFVLTLLVIPILISVVINIPVIVSPFTPKVHGKVIDAETKRPLEGINIKAGWTVNSATVGGSSGGYYKLYKTKTDSNGEFILPRGMKALNKWFLFGTSNFGGVNVTIYPSNYEYKVARINYTDNPKVEIKLDKVKSDKEFLDNIQSYWHGLFLMHKGVGDDISDPYERGWLKYSYYIFEKTYPNSIADTESILRDIANILETLKEPDCIYLLQKILDKYPNGTLAWQAKKNIVPLKQIYGVK